MTNGEKMIEIFPNAEISYGLRGVVVVTFIHKTIFDLDWWNAEYKEPNKSEIITSSDCVDRHAVDMLAYRYLREPTDNHVAFYEDFLDLPPVTPIEPKGHGYNGNVTPYLIGSTTDIRSLEENKWRYYKMMDKIEQARQTYEASMDYGDAYREQELVMVALVDIFL